MNERSHAFFGLVGRRGLFIGRLFQIEFYLHYSWFLIAGFLAYTLSADVFPTVIIMLPVGVYATMGACGALLFFLSIILHELGHSLISQRCGIPVPRITLFFIGGVAEISREPDNARSELLIAIGGPLVSMLLAGLFAVGSWLCRLAHLHPAAIVLGWLSAMNVVLILFNLVPGYPLDGGRILRALLWARSGKLRRATYITSRIGIGFSWCLLVTGVVLLVMKYWSGSAFLLISIFLKSAAESGYTHALQKEVLAGITVRDVMTPHPVCIPADLPLNLVVDDVFMTHHHVAFPVIGAEGEFRGLLRLEFLKDVPREKWPWQSAGDLAAERETSLLRVDVQTTAARVMRSLLNAETGRLAVTEGEKTVGIITRHDILQFIKIHTELEG